MIDNSLDGSFVSEVAELVHPEPKLVAIPRGQNMWMAGGEKEIIGAPLLAEPKALKVSTLSAIVDAINTPSLYASSGGAVVHVVSPTEVRIVDPVVGEEKQQFIYMVAQANPPQISYRQFMPLDEFIISLLAMSGDTPGRTKVLDYVGGLTAGLATEINDDGAAQSTVAKRGITRAGAPAKWENPVPLAPFRTFAEIEQPVSAFVLRLRQNKVGEDLTAQAALFEADGGAWQREAILGIGEWLRAHLPENTVVLA